MPNISDLMNTLPQVGIVEWIGIRPSKGEAMQLLSHAQLQSDHGIAGDRYSKVGGNRQITLIQAEHIDAIASLTGQDTVEPSLLRRNIVIRGLNLLALKHKQFRIGEAICEFSGLCHPCSKMEDRLGPGGYNAMRGHGGINAKVLSSGVVSLNDSLYALTEVSQLETQ